MPLTLRPLSRDDRPEWDRLWTGYLEFYEAVRPREVYDTTFARLLDPSVDQHCLLGLVDEQPAGLVHFLYHPHHWHIAPVCYLQDLYVSPDVRGHGMGRALIEAVYAAADTRGAADVYWNTQDVNATARALYDRVGVKTPFIKYRRGVPA